METVRLCNAYCEDGVLTISGHGAAVPDGEWSGWGGTVRNVFVEEGITELASYLFADMQDLEGSKVCRNPWSL